MSNTPIASLPVAIGLTGAEDVPVVQGDVTKRAKASLFDFAGGSGGGAQAANSFYAGPTTGAAAPPSFRAMVVADLPGNLISAATSGGIPYFSSTAAVSSSALLAASRLVLGGGAGASPSTLGSLGTTTTVLHGNASGAPSFGAVSLTADVSGVLPLANGGVGANLSATGGTSQVLKQVSAGANVTVAQLTNSDISGLGTAAVKNTGTSGNTIPLLDGTNTWSGGQTISLTGSASYPLNAAHTDTTTTAANSGIVGSFTSSNATGTRSSATGIIGNVLHNAAGTATTLVGTYGSATQSAGTVTRLEGLAGNAIVSGGACANLQAVPAIVQISGGTVTEAAVFRSEGIYVSAGTVGNVYGMLLDPISITGGTVTNAYGVYMNMPTGATNNKGLYLTGIATNVWGHVNSANGYNCGLIFEQNGGVNGYLYRPDGTNKFLFANSSVATALAVDLTNQRISVGGGSSPVNTLEVLGSVGFGAPVTKTNDFTVGATENDLICNKGSSLTVTLPGASSFTGRRLRIKTIAAFAVVSVASDVVPLAGGAAGTAILAATAGKWAEIVSDGTNWVIMASN